MNIIERHIGAGITEEEAVNLGLPKKSYLPETLEEKALIEWCKDECIRQAFAIPFVNDALIRADTVQKMQERFNEKVGKLLIDPSIQYQASAFLDQIAKELIDGQ